MRTLSLILSAVLACTATALPSSSYPDALQRSSNVDARSILSPFNILQKREDETLTKPPSKKKCKKGKCEDYYKKVEEGILQVDLKDFNKNLYEENAERKTNGLGVLEQKLYDWGEERRQLVGFTAHDREITKPMNAARGKLLKNIQTVKGLVEKFEAAFKRRPRNYGTLKTANDDSRKRWEDDAANIATWLRIAWTEYSDLVRNWRELLQNLTPFVAQMSEASDMVGLNNLPKVLVAEYKWADQVKTYMEQPSSRSGYDSFQVTVEKFLNRWSDLEMRTENYYKMVKRGY